MCVLAAELDVSREAILMLVLGYAGHRRHGWAANVDAKLKSRLRHSVSHPTIFSALTSFGEYLEDLPLNLFPLDGMGHDSGAALLQDGKLAAAAAEERFCRLKHASARGGRTLGPRRAAEFCLQQVDASFEDVDHIAFYCDFPFESLQQRIAAIAPHLAPDIRQRVTDAYRAVHAGTVSNERIAEEIACLLDGRVGNAKLHFVPHHLAHAASAFY